MSEAARKWLEDYSTYIDWLYSDDRFDEQGHAQGEAKTEPSARQAASHIRCLLDENESLREYIIEEVGIEHVPKKFGGELD